MSADLAAKLRLLAHDHHDGRLDLAAYRALRAPLLDSLILNVYSVKAAMDVTQPRAMARQADAELTQPSKPQAQGRPAVSRADRAESPGAGHGASLSNASPSASAPKSLGLVVTVVAVALLAAAAVAWMMLKGRASDDVAPDTATSASEAVRFRNLVDDFLGRGDWSDGRLTALNATLLELGGERMAPVARELWFQRFVDELRRRLKEQQALASAPLTADNSPLAALAVTVGLDLNSPDAAIHIAALPPPRPSVHESAQLAPMSTTPTSPVASGATQTAHHAAQESPVTSTGPDSRPTGQGVGGTSALVASATPSSAAPAASASPVAKTNDSPNSCRVELLRSRRPLCNDTLPSGAEGPQLAMVPAGAFEMGGKTASEEQPVHRVTIHSPFAISVYEVSQGDFKQFCEHTKRSCASQPWSGDDYPAVNVSWDDARAYTDWLSSVTHRRYTLPTEAQWEYAARAGQTGPFPGGDTLSPTDAHYSMLAKQTAAARRSQKFNANAFRLMHTIGNVREWVEDAWSPGFSGAPVDGSAVTPAQATTRVVRGGAYVDGVARLRLSMREGLPAGTRDVTTGFRIVRELP